MAPLKPLRTQALSLVSQPTRGYGRACRAGMNAAVKAGADIVVFIDGDGSDCPEFINDLIRPIQENRFDFVIGSRTRGIRERGSLNCQQIFAARLAGWLLRVRYGVNFTDMSPFRAIRSELLRSLPMREETYGWNLEMQMLAGPEAGPHPGNPCESSQAPWRRLQSFRHFQRNDTRDIPYRRDILSRRL